MLDTVPKKVAPQISQLISGGLPRFNNESVANELLPLVSRYGYLSLSEFPAMEDMEILNGVSSDAVPTSGLSFSDLLNSEI